MKPISKILAVLAFVLLAYLPVNSSALDVNVSGSWTGTNIGENDLANDPVKAGSDFNSYYESDNDQLSLSIIDAENQNWTVTAKLGSLSVWAGTLKIKRSDVTSDWLTLTDTEQNFFTGTGNLSDIPIQLQLDNISVQINAGSYSTSIIFNIYTN